MVCGIDNSFAAVQFSTVPLGGLFSNLHARKSQYISRCLMEPDGSGGFVYVYPMPVLLRFDRLNTP
jgi:hypothetical protein